MGCHIFKSWIGRSTQETEFSARRHPFCACRCFRKELRRIIRAFAARTASFLVSFAFGGNALGQSASFEPDIAGSDGAGIVELWSTGCMLMGPAHRGLLVCINDNALPPNLFEVIDRTDLQLPIPAFARRRPVPPFVKGSVVPRE